MPRVTSSSIKNKIKREDVYRALKKKRGQAKLARRLALAEAERKDPQEKRRRLAENVPKTLDNMRDHDPSVLTADPVAPIPASSDSIDSAVPPKVLITTSIKATKATFDFCEELVGVVPGGEFVRRKSKNFEIGKIAGWAAGRGYGSLLVVNEDRKQPNAITMVHLPHGPTAHFKLTSVQLTKEIFVRLIEGHARASPHHPELVLNGFVTRLGHTVGRMFQTLFPPLPEFAGGKRHRYMFKSADKAALQEIGPRFTLKLRYLRTGTPAVHQLGAAPPSLTFDREDDSEETGEQEGKDASSEIGPPPQGEGYIWAWKPQLEKSRKTFFL
ncbi:hypothetical protein BS47DRAFT_1395247 [Hydnum rufescens UP504]|uniref:Brix domain-containing protein n=1 Tax=Hydnum rufescens UP504 TaxID=1448309 RepID=A0A9P6ASQ1_9AGAM|nr:hypothetical protein BS47DRAFT_1395247 [Hydnum rufescens UP504]